MVCVCHLSVSSPLPGSTASQTACLASAQAYLRPTLSTCPPHPLGTPVVAYVSAPSQRTRSQVARHQPHRTPTHSQVSQASTWSLYSTLGRPNTRRPRRPIQQSRINPNAHHTARAAVVPYIPLPPPLPQPLERKTFSHGKG